MEDAHGTPPDDGRCAVHQRAIVADSALAAEPVPGPREAALWLDHYSAPLSRYREIGQQRRRLIGYG
jgi:hypothetical protein